MGLRLPIPSERVVAFNPRSCYKQRRMCWGVFRCVPLLSAGTASASSRNPLCGVFRHVLFPQDKEDFGRVTSHEENGFVFSRSQRSSAPNNHHNSESKLYSTVAKYHFSEGNTRRLQRESEDDETPQRAFFASEEAHREPAESVVYFRSGTLRRSL